MTSPTPADARWAGLRVFAAAVLRAFRPLPRPCQSGTQTRTSTAETETGLCCALCCLAILALDSDASDRKLRAKLAEKDSAWSKSAAANHDT